MKKCNTCLVEKETSEYYVNSRNKDKLENTCKECIKIKNKNNREKLRESQRRWREKNPDYMKKYGQSDKSKEYHKEYYKEHKGRIYKKKTRMEKK